VVQNCTSGESRDNESCTDLRAFARLVTLMLTPQMTLKGISTPGAGRASKTSVGLAALASAVIFRRPRLRAPLCWRCCLRRTVIGRASVSASWLLAHPERVDCGVRQTDLALCRARPIAIISKSFAVGPASAVRPRSVGHAPRHCHPSMLTLRGEGPPHSRRGRW